MARAQRARHDGWTGERRRGFIEALRVSGCVADACREARLSCTSAYRLRARDPGFAEQWAAAQREARTSLGLVAWRRAVEGVAIPIVRGGEVVGHWNKPSDSMLRLLLAGGGGNGAARGADGQFARPIKPNEVIDAEEFHEGWGFTTAGVKFLHEHVDIARARMLLAIMLKRLGPDSAQADRDIARTRDEVAEAERAWAARKPKLLEHRRATGQWNGSFEGWPREKR